MNDVVLCAMAGGLHRYLEAIGVATRGLELTALVPVSLRCRERRRRRSATASPRCWCRWRSIPTRRSRGWRRRARSPSG